MNKPCPICKSQGKSNNLLLRQINYSSAVYLCQDTTCKYPEGQEWILVDRSLEQLAKEIRPSNDDLNRWLEEVFENEVGDGYKQSNMKDSNTNNFLAELFKEIGSNDDDNYDDFVSKEFTTDLYDSANIDKQEFLIDIYDDLKSTLTSTETSQKKQQLNDVSNVKALPVSSNTDERKNNQSSKFQDFHFTSEILRPAY